MLVNTNINKKIQTDIHHSSIQDTTQVSFILKSKLENVKRYKEVYLRKSLLFCYYLPGACNLKIFFSVDWELEPCLVVSNALRAGEEALELARACCSKGMKAIIKG